MLTYKSFDVSTLEVGDVIYNRYESGETEKELIIAINREDTNEPTYSVVCSSSNYDYNYGYEYSEYTLANDIHEFTYWIKKPLVGLELI